MIDLIGELRRIMNASAAETFDQSTDSLEAIRNFLTSTQGLFYRGEVIDIPGANQFTSTDLVGFGNTAFVNWWVFVFHDAGGAGAAPQGEARLVTAYVSATGVFTHNAFSAPLAAGDIVLILHPWLYGAIIRSTDATYSHPSGVAEQVAFTITPLYPLKILTIYLDLVNLTQNATIRIQTQIDGATYRRIETFNWTTGMDDGVYFRGIAIDTPLQVTIQSAVAEGAPRDIPYRYFEED